MHKTEVKRCEQLPIISDHADSAIAFALIEDQLGYVVFDSHRDFLSAPKAYAVIRIRFSSARMFASGGQFLTDELWAQLQTASFGVFEMINSTYCEQENETHYVFYSREMIFECVAEQIELIDTLYHHSSSYAALKSIVF